MATKVHMEALSPTMEEGQIVKWLKSEGDAVTNGDVLAEIETDKATMELVARGAGVLRKILLGEGATAPVGQVIAVIGAQDEDISQMVEEASGNGAGAAATEARGGEEAEEAAEAEPPEAEAGPEDPAAAAVGEAGAEAPAPAPEAGGRIKASPVARKLAREAGLELGGIEGSGPGGRIVKRDVEEAREEAERAPARPAAAAAVTEDDYEDVGLSQMRKTIARRLVESLAPVPHFFLTVEVDMGRALEARARINSLLEEEGRKVSINDLILKATAQALRKHPECNAHWKGDAIRRFNRVHLGVAVAVEDGLITPVVRDAHLKGVAAIASEVRELAARAREKRLKPDEYTGATFSVSNLGMLGIHEFTAVINPPEAGILAVGGVEETPVAVDGQLVVRRRMKMTMSCDHRAIDGATGARFLRTLKTMLEEPGAMVA